jgi:hypothetical protein
MANTNDLVYVVESLGKFNSKMKELGVTYENLKQISEELIDISHHLEVIQNWRMGNDMINLTEPIISIDPVVEDKPDHEPEIILEPLDDLPIEEEEPVPEPVVEKPRKHAPHQVITHDAARSIAQYVADKYDGKFPLAVVTPVAKKFKENEKGVKRLLTKETFADKTDPYFTLVDGKIRKVVKTMPSIFTGVGAEKKITDLLRKNKYDVIKCISDDMSPNDIIKLAMCRYIMYTSNEVGELGGGVKEIFIMEAISNNRSANSSAIIKRIKQTYNVDVDVQLISAVRTGRAYKEISSRFGV